MVALHTAETIIDFTGQNKQRSLCMIQESFVSSSYFRFADEDSCSGILAFTAINILCDNDFNWIAIRPEAFMAKMPFY